MVIILISKKATVTWNSKNKKHYTDLGYVFTKMKDSFEADVGHLTKGSSAVVALRCDYCGATYQIKWDTYNNKTSNSAIKKDACGNCCEAKCREAIDLKYGGYNGLNKATKNKREQTNLQKYGSKNVFGNKDIQKQIRLTNVQKYGAEHCMQNKEVLNKAKQTCKEKYGVEYYVELYKGKFIKEKSPCWKGGTKFSRVERATYEYAQWRKGVFSRDHYTCQKCGAKSKCGTPVELQAHHILNWRDNAEQRYELNNGVTLCSECHLLFHVMYGKKNNNHEQIVKFLKQR